MSDPWLPRLIVGGIIAIALLTCSATAYAAIIQGVVPPGLSSLAGTSVGALAGLAAGLAARRNNGGSTNHVSQPPK
jgi:hypothetical protein